MPSVKDRAAAKTKGRIRIGGFSGGLTNAQLFELMANTQSIKRGEQVSDLVGSVSFLASEDAGFITGQTLYVNGGNTHTT
jgi:NAD(P)-dependent dehydrogenase (short-subunit alcohol dehydrogenase family)